MGNAEAGPGARRPGSEEDGLVRWPGLRWLDDRWARWAAEGDPRDGQRVPAWMFAKDLLIVGPASRLWDVEWDENWRAWPHCCTQGGCWMHVTSSAPWCRCGCRWCKAARLLDRARRPRAGTRAAARPCPGPGCEVSSRGRVSRDSPPAGDQDRPGGSPAAGSPAMLAPPAADSPFRALPGGRKKTSVRAVAGLARSARRML